MQKILCKFGLHSWTSWKTMKAKFTGIFKCYRYAAIVQIRECKVCGKSSWKEF